MALAFFYGTFMRGQPGEANLAGASFLGEARSAARYRLYSIRGEHPLMLEAEGDGAEVAGQLFEVPDELWGRILAAEPPGVHMTTIELADGRVVQGMLGEPDYVAAQGRDITDHGGWAAYLASRAP